MNDIKKKLAFIAKAIYIAALIGFFGYFFFWIAPESRRRHNEKRAKFRNEIEIIKPYAEIGDADAQYRLAQIFSYNGEGWLTDYKEAHTWAVKAAQSGHMKAQLLVGALCENSLSERGLRGVECSRNEVLKWYRMAAEQGESVAQFRLADNLYNWSHITGIPKEEAYKWYLRSATQGNPPASLFVGANMYYVGAGVEKDLIKAYMWVRLATKGIDNWTVAEKTLGKIAKKMSPDEIGKAEDLAKRWVPRNE